MMNAVGVALLLFAAAFLLMVAGVLAILLATLREAQRRGGRAEGGAVLIVGPVPLAFATGERVARSLITLAILLTAFAVAVFLVLMWLLPQLVRL